VKKINTKFFRFYDENQKKSWVLIFKSPDQLPSEFDADWYYENILPEMVNRDLEVKYGIHDYDTHGDDMLIGYTSYEVEADDFPALMAEWKDIFQKLGIDTGEVMAFDGDVI
jgi:hypothetical protein